MKGLNQITLILIIIGGINWGLFGLFGFNLIGTIFGFAPIIATILYILVGASAIYQAIPLTRTMTAAVQT
ncbi:MAG: DUF378 domain-containing protein [Bauldia sp.]